MFSAKNINNATSQQLAAKLFDQLIASGKFATQANTILAIGKKLLDESKNLTRIEFDKIVIGTLLLALARNDSKYYFHNKCVPENLNAETFQHITSKSIKPSPFYVSNFYSEHEIRLTGKMVLEDKTIAFDGTFSKQESVQKMIANGLPFMDNQYLEDYDIKPVRHLKCSQ